MHFWYILKTNFFFEKLPVADSQVYKHIFDIFCNLKKKTFENLPVAESQVYERIFDIFLHIEKNFWKFTCERTV